MHKKKKRRRIKNYKLGNLSKYTILRIIGTIECKKTSRNKPLKRVLQSTYG